jgi:hypothetical protein
MFKAFELERWQSTWENRVKFNLSESGVHPLTIEELLRLSGSDPAEFLRLRLVYSQSDGTDELRHAIAALYDGATADNVVVTIGSAEANFVACWALVRPGDDVAILAPTYMQTWGLSENLGARVTPIWLHYERGWEPDPEEIARAITGKTRLVVVTNPNNPTGHVLSDAARDAIVDRARAVGAWLLADEVYTGAERTGTITPSFWGSYERVVVVNGFSKAYGLPGLRIGWIACSPDLRREILARHDYTVIGPSPAMDWLAIRALCVRERILGRTRRILETNYPVLEGWLRGFGDFFQWHETECGAIALVRYRGALSALDLVEQIRARHDILLVPGDHFELPRHLRLGYGNDTAELKAALADLEPAVREVMGD